MIEEIVYNHIKDSVDAPVYMMRPENVPVRYVLIEKTGGAEQNHIKRSTFAFQSYGTTLEEAAQLNEIVKAAARSLADLPEVSGSHYSTDYNFTNTATKQPRYQAVFDLFHY